MILTFITQINASLGFLAIVLLIGLLKIRQVQQRSSTVVVPVKARE